MSLTYPHQKEARRVSIACLAFKRVRSGSLVGFADLHLPRMRLKLFGCAVHTSHGKRWVQVPSKAQLDHQRELIRDRAGKPQYSPVIAWDSDEVRRAFSDAAVAAVEAYDPLAFAAEAS